MRQAQWQLQTAKAQLSELVEAALRGNPKYGVRHHNYITICF